MDNSVKCETETELYLNPVCSCCLGGQNLKNMLLTYYHHGNPEIYSQMFSKCFSSELIPIDDTSQENLYFICEICICNLRNAFSFKNQVENSQKTLRSKIGLKTECQPKSPKREEDDYFETVNVPEFAESIKSESEYEIPLKVIKKHRKLKKYHKKSKLLRKERKKKMLLKDKDIHTNTYDFDQIENTDLLEESKININLDDECIKKKTRKDEVPYKLEEDAVTCKICNETFPWHSNLVRHMHVHFPNHICHICATPFATERALQAHVYRHNLTQETCEICKKTYKGKDHLKQHMKKHMDFNALYKCLHCPERFDSYYRRTKHLIDVHNDEARKYKCKQCPKAYMQASALSSHVRSVHLQEKKFVCNVCGFAFFKNAYLTAHMYKHNGIKNFECEICHKAYGRKNAYIQHTKIHLNEKKFVCSECGKAFNQKCVLKVHLKKHEKEKEDENILKLD